MELDFNRDDLEMLLFKKASLDKKWMNILVNTFDERFFKTKNLDIVARMLVKFYSKYGHSPSIKALTGMMKAYASKYPDKGIDLAEVNALLNAIMSFDLNVPDDVANTNLKEFIRRESFYNALYDNADLLNSDEGNYEKVVTKCLENFDRVQKITFNDTDLGMNYFDPAAMAKHWEYIMNPEAKIKTGWSSIDSFTHGGFLKDGRSLYLVMAQAGLGKSLFLSNLAVNFLEQGLSVVVISLEMSEDVYAQRFDAHITNYDINNLQEVKDNAIDRINSFYKEHPTSHLYIKEYPPKSVTCNDIRAYLESLKNNGYNFDVIIVDYLNLVKSANTRKNGDNMFIDGLDVSEQLRAISYEMHCPVISAIQTNREGMNNENVGMENISQSSGIAFTADFLMSMFQTDEDRDGGTIRGRILKNRLGGMVGNTVTFSLNVKSLRLMDTTYIPDIDIPDDDISNSIAVSSNMSKDMAAVDSDLSSL